MITGTYLNTMGLNGTQFTHQPTDHHWVAREPIGIDGNGTAVYPALREYEMKFDFIDTEEWNSMYQAFLAEGVTGTVVVTLPKWNTTPYTMYNYSGCIVREIEYENWFQNYYVGVRLLVVRILT